MFPLIILEMFLQLDWSPPVVNSTDCTWCGKARTCLYKVRQLTVHVRAKTKPWGRKNCLYRSETGLCWGTDLGEAWGRQHYAVAMFFSGRYWETNWRKYERSKVQRDLDENLLQSEGEGSPSNRTTTLSTQPRQRTSGLGTSLCLWLAQPEPWLEPDQTSLERPGNSCAVTLLIQPDRAWEDLQRRMGDTPQI
jgi:hypothetical protein